jgi:hypothetical protein
MVQLLLVALLPAILWHGIILKEQSSEVLQGDQILDTYQFPYQ